jgi:lipoate-protein ligase A
VTATLYRDEPGACERGTKSEQSEPFLCFQRRSCYDLVCGGAKIAGSAQRRRRGAIVQHGSVLLSQSAFAPELPGIEQLAGVVIDPAALAACWKARLATRLGVSLGEGPLSAEEQERCRMLASAKYAAESHLARR